jgi:high mobility group protein B1
LVWVASDVAVIWQMATVPVSDFVSGKHKVYGPDGSSFVTCGCGSKKSAPAVQWLTKITSCPGKCEQNTAWLQTFQIKDIAAPVKGKTPKKSAESSSKATTPTKDGDSADKAVSDEEVKQKKSAKKQKVDKEPKAPKSKTPTAKADEGEAKTKRPAGAYFVFCEAKRAEAKEANAEKALAAKELGEMWKALSEEEKEPYTTKAKQLKADYDEVKGQTESGKKKAAKAEGPKKARTAYMIFSEYIRPQILEEFPGIQAKEVMKLQGPKWKELSAEDKKIWEDKAKEEKEVFANSSSHLSLCLVPPLPLTLCSSASSSAAKFCSCDENRERERDRQLRC